MMTTRIDVGMKSLDTMPVVDEGKMSVSIDFGAQTLLRIFAFVLTIVFKVLRSPEW